MLKVCEECGYQMSDKAQACPNCGKVNLSYIKKTLIKRSIMIFFTIFPLSMLTIFLALSFAFMIKS